MRDPAMPSWGRRWGWLVLPALAALALLALGLLVPADRWAEAFQTDLAFPDIAHASRPTAETGARLLRLMLLITPACMLLASVVVARLNRRGPARSEAIDGGVSGQGPYASRELWIITGLIALALIARLPRLGESLWYDEIAAWADYGMRGPGWIVGTYYDPANHILHTLLTWWTIQWLGFDAFALRLPALLFSIASVVPVYGLTRCAGGPRTALLAGVCAAVLPVMVLEGAEARGYSMMIFFSAAASWAFASAWIVSRPWKWIVYALCCALGVWAHFTTAFIAIGHGAWIAWRFVRHGERALPGCAASALLLGAALAMMLCAPILPQLLAIRSTFATVEGDEPGILGPEGWHALLQLGGSWYWWAAIPGLWLMVHGLWHTRGNVQRRNALALSLAGLPLFIATVALAGSWMYARFTLFALPGACVAIAFGLDGLWRWQRPAGMAAATIIIAASVADLAARPPKQPLREAVALVRASAQAGDRVLAIGLAHPVLQVYAGDLNLAYALRHGADINQSLGREQPRWIILYYPRSVPQETYQRLSDAGFAEAHRFRGWVDWDNGDVLVYRH